MKLFSRNLIFLAGLFCIFQSMFLPAPLNADGQSEQSFKDPNAAPNQVDMSATPNQASDATFDKRLPPVLPGEVVGDSGRRMKLWSTSGAVPVGRAPNPFDAPAAPGVGAVGAEAGAQNSNQIPGNVGVIVDRRSE